MKWSLYQILMIIFIVVSMWLLEYTGENRTVQSITGEWTAVISKNATFFIVALIVTFIYLFFLFEAKKKKSLFNHLIWRRMPIICAGVGILSIILFIVGVTEGPVMVWVEKWRFLFYVFLIYFLFLVFLFIFSFEQRKQRNSQQHEKNIHISFIWTLLLFFALFILF